MKRLTIDRSRWLRGPLLGSKNDYSCLLRRGDMRMCCLGFLAVDCGIPKEDLLEVASPAATSKAHRRLWPEGTLVPNSFGELENSLLMEKLMAANDDAGTDEAFREKRIQELFSLIGYEVVFVDGPTT